MAIYQIFPSYIAPMLSAVSILCFIAPITPTPNLIRILGSAQVFFSVFIIRFQKLINCLIYKPGGGLGLLSISLDWSIIGAHAPITTPLWALLNQFAGIWFFMWVLVPILWGVNFFGIDQKLGTDPYDGLFFLTINFL